MFYWTKPFRTVSSGVKHPWVQRYRISDPLRKREASFKHYHGSVTADAELKDLLRKWTVK